MEFPSVYDQGFYLRAVKIAERVIVLRRKGLTDLEVRSELVGDFEGIKIRGKFEDFVEGLRNYLSRFSGDFKEDIAGRQGEFEFEGSANRRGNLVKDARPTREDVKTYLSQN